MEQVEMFEEEVTAMKIMLFPPPDPFYFEFVIRVDGQEVWSGTDLPKKYPEILHTHPNAQIAIGWRSSPVILI